MVSHWWSNTAGLLIDNHWSATVGPPVDHQWHNDANSGLLELTLVVHWSFVCHFSGGPLVDLAKRLWTSNGQSLVVQHCWSIVGLPVVSH
jgi:hypothetical protein